MTGDDIPKVVYAGHQTEAIFLKSLLEGSGIPASLVKFSVAGNVDVRVQVATRDLKRTLPIVEHFRIHGKKSDPW